MDLFGVKLAEKVKRVSTDKDDIILNPDEIFPPPQIRGKVTNVKIENGLIVQIFGDGDQEEHASGFKNFMAYRGAALRFGKLTMNDTDLILIDADPSDPFDSYLQHYVEQLAAGYTKTTPQFGLRVHMVDYKKLHRKGAPREKQKMRPRETASKVEDNFLRTY